jgi:hypothetical protein
MNRDIRNIEEYITQNKTPGTVSVYDDTRTARGTNRNGESVRDSATSSVLSETNTSAKKGHYSKKNVPRGSKNKANNAGDNKSGNCETGCNIF